MAISNSKPQLLLSTTENAFSAPLMVLFFFFLLLNNVKSDSVSFSFPRFPQDVESVTLIGDAGTSGGALKLTKSDQLGNPIPQSVGQAVYPAPIHLYDKSTGKLADFPTEFSFVVNPKSTTPHGDGFTFFLVSLDSEFPENATGGYLGLFSPKTAFDHSKNPIVAVEFDSFGNEWDPFALPVAPHIGIDVQSLRSVKTVAWPINAVPAGAIGKARITYYSKTKELEVGVTYIHDQPNMFASLTLALDLRTVLPEWVGIGFSAATGAVVETHDILSWSFISNL